eukprot:CAMPEP_0170884528 /NCGR_PEP_ID=MMETSP0734-20130129/35079_1 /TAXON_ID=186038 /ORGANISM="Fragilariopsis kerguelensis, Strain L26-C5" /LENGTH=304 /DNA_ID=CAMNT_0011269249 /DNA_START=45 /DNA_END=955 /DNA_ORIENTATION=-
MVNSENVDATINARSVINRLQGDFQGKKTCRDCLRSKTLPCPTVVEIADDDTIFATIPSSSSMSSSMSFKIILRAHEIILSEYSHFLPTVPDGVEEVEEDTKIVTGRSSVSIPLSASYSSLVCMKRISVILRFVQLLLLLSDRQQQHPSREIFHLPSVAEVNKMMQSLLQAWTNGICEFVHEWKNNTANQHQDEIEDDDIIDNQDSKEHDPFTADATRNLRSGPIFCYAFSAFLSKRRGALLVPLWKGICDISETLLLSPSSTEDDDENENVDNEQNYEWRKRLDPNILGGAIRILGDFLREGK